MNILFDHINIKEAPYSAKGDGTTDDTTAIQTAINSVSPGGTIYFPLQSGTYYKITAPLDLSGAMGIHLTSDSRSVDAELSVGPQARIFASMPSVSGSTASVTTVTADPNGSGKNTVMTITGLSSLTSSMVGYTITLSGCATIGNIGSFTILSVNVGSNLVTAMNNNYDRFTGAALATASDANSGHIVWNIKPPMFKCWTRGVHFENLWLDGNNTVSTVIDATQGLTSLCTNISVSYCQLWNAIWNMKIGDFGPNATYQGNNDFFELHKSYFISPTLSAVYIPNSTGQSKHHRFSHCSFNDGYNAISLISGSFSTDHCSFASHTEASVKLGAITDTIQIRDTDSEHCARLLMTNGDSSSPWQVTINGGRFDVLSSEIISDQQYISWTLGNTLIVSGCDFAQGITGLGNFSIGMEGWDVSGSNAVITGCAFPSDTSQIIKRVTGGSGVAAVALSFGNVCNSASNGLVAVPDGQITTDPNSNVQAVVRGFQTLTVSEPAQPWIYLTAGANNNVTRPFYTTAEVTSAYVTNDFNITGVASGVDGLVFEIYNLTSHVMTLNHLNGGSTSANQLYSFTGSDVVGAHYAKLRYSSAKGAWIIAITG